MKSLLTRIIIVFLAFILLQSAITYLFLYFLYSEALVQKSVRANAQKLEQITANLETLIEVAVAASNQICLDYENSELLLLPHETFYDWYKEKMFPMKKRLESVQSGALYRYNSNVYIFATDGATYNASHSSMGDLYGVQGLPWYQEALDANGYMVWVLQDDLFPFINAEQNRIAVLRTIYTKYNKQIAGVLLITMEFNASLDDLFRYGEAGQTLLIVDDEGQIAVGDPGASIPTIDWDAIPKDRSVVAMEQSLHGDRYFINVSPVSKAGWRVVQILDQRTILQEIASLRNYGLLVSVLITLVAALLIVVISRRITQPLRNLSEMLKAVGKGNFSLVAPVEGQDEIAQISYSYNLMVREIDLLLERVRRENQLHERTMLNALRAQINPHFLLNTLNDIKWMAIIEKNMDVAGMLTTLGALLENTLGRHDEFITLRQELQNTNDYVKLQRMRYNNKFTIHTEIDEETKDLIVPIMILQPLIENAVLHGFSDIESGGVITVRTYLDGGDLHITVCDNGRGIPPDKRMALEASLPDLYAKENENIGLANVHRRLVLCYGPGYGLSIEMLDAGTCIHLTLPKEAQHAERDDR